VESQKVSIVEKFSYLKRAERVGHSEYKATQRYSIATSLPSAKPASLKPRKNAATDGAHSLAVALPRSPITGSAGCCARAVSGQAAAAPPSVMNCRRLMSDMGPPAQE